MGEDYSKLNQFHVLRDDPLFINGAGFNPSEDAFNHAAYAKALFEILSHNEPPLSIGLFGPWGIGKSTVVGILEGLIKGDNKKRLKQIYFNAWKYSGDSFRRQFLISVAKQVYEAHPDATAKV